MKKVSKKNNNIDPLIILALLVCAYLIFFFYLKNNKIEKFGDITDPRDGKKKKRLRKLSETEKIFRSKLIKIIMQDTSFKQGFFGMKRPKEKGYVWGKFNLKKKPTYRLIEIKNEDEINYLIEKMSTINGKLNSESFKKIMKSLQPKKKKNIFLRYDDDEKTKLYNKYEKTK